MTDRVLMMPWITALLLNLGGIFYLLTRTVM